MILPHGVLFRGKKEAAIRRNLIRKGYIKGIIGLPANLFYGTGIPACIIVLDKENAANRTGIFMIDASRGFLKDGNKNRLRAQDIHRIVDVFTRQADVEGYSRMVPVAEIASPANDYNLNIPRHIDSSEPEDIQDLDAHLNGGIPERDIDALEPYWKVFPSMRDVLFEPNGRPGYSEAKVETHEVKPTIVNHTEFVKFAKKADRIVEAWVEAHRPLLMGLGAKTLPAGVIHTISEDLLERFARLPLLSRYDAYQRLMDYWAETMQDDVYLIVADGWVDAAQPRPVIDDKKRKIHETPDLMIGSKNNAKKYKMDLIPPRLIVARYFKPEREALDLLEIERDTAAAALEEFTDEHSGEEGALEPLKNDKDKVTKGAVTARLKELAKAMDEEDEEERQALERWVELSDAESVAKARAKAARDKLDRAVLAKYRKLDEAAIKTLVVEDKWFVAVREGISGEVMRLTNALAGRVRELEERYAATLPQIEEEVAGLTAKVEGHLRQMGLVWA